jgi:uridine phosphorylase
MNRAYTSIIALTLAAFGASQAIAADAPKTREQVRAEAAAALAAGDFIVENGQKANELYPGLYNSNKPPATAKARDDVKAELRDAVRNGEMLAYGETTVTVRDVFPGNYRAQ